jgi:hypothetical protein
MKLAEGLIQRADDQKRIEQLKSRIVANARVQEGDEPAEDPNVLLAEVERIAADLKELIQRINRTNAATPLEEKGQSIADAIAERDILRLRHGVHAAAADAALIRQDRYSKSEVRFESTMDVAGIRETADDLARAYRELDTRIQEANWRVELMD